MLPIHSQIFLFQAPANYEGVDFQTRALQQSKIDLTWDENEPQRTKKLKRKINIDKVCKICLILSFLFGYITFFSLVVSWYL